MVNDVCRTEYAGLYSVISERGKVARVRREGRTRGALWKNIRWFFHFNVRVAFFWPLERGGILFCYSIWFWFMHFFINPAIVRGKVNQGKGIYYFTAWCWALPWAMHAYSFRSILPSIIAHVSNTIIIIMMMVFYVGVSIWSNLCYHMSLHDAVTFYYHIVIFAVLFVCSNSFPSFPCEQVHSLVTSSSQ